jgi:hypothetical protein
VGFGPRAAFGLALAMSIAVGVGGVASAAPAAASPTTVDAPGPRLERACRRIPDLQERVGRALERIDGSAETRGSLAWLEGRIAKAEAAGRTDAVEVLQNRLATRTSVRETLVLRSAELDDLASRCAELGIEL